MSKKIIENIGFSQNNLISVVTGKISDAIGVNKKILNAVLIINQAKTVKGNVNAVCGCEETKTIDEVFSRNNYKLYINVTHEIECLLKNGKEALIICLPEGSSCGQIDMKIEYTAQQIMHQNNKYVEINLKNKCGGKVNLANGDLWLETPWLVFNNALAKAQINYNNEKKKLNQDAKIYNVTLVDDAFENLKEFKTCCGLGWKLKLSQFLVKRMSGNDETIYTYIDGNGNYHEFNEKYYYLKDGEKHYVSKNEVKMDLKGNLTCTVIQVNGNGFVPIRTGRDPAQPVAPNYSYIEKEVFIERKSTSGLLLETDYTQFKNGKYLEVRLQEQIELEEKFKAYANQLKEYVFIYQKDGSQVYNKKLKDKFDDDELTIESFNEFFNFDGVATGEKLLLTESEDIQYNSLLLQQTKKIEDGLSIGKEIKELNLSYEDYSLVNLQSLLHSWYADKKLADACKVNEGLDEGEKDNYVEKIANLEKPVNSFLANEQGAIVNQQLLKVIEQSIKNEEDIQTYFKQYLSLKQQLDNLYIQMPVNFITDGETVKGFNKYGQLVATIDSYDNQIVIIYEDDKIVAVKDSDNRQITFKYNSGGYISQIIDYDEKITKFSYKSGNINKITFDNGEIFDVTYVNKKLEQVTDEYGRGVKFNYDNYSRVTGAKRLTNLCRVSENDVLLEDKTETESGDETELNNNEDEGITIADIAYKGLMTTSITDENGVITTYIFDQSGKPVTMYEGNFDENNGFTKAVSLEYVDGKQSYSVTEDFDSDNALIDINSLNTLDETNAVRQLRYCFDQLPEGKTDFVFSCWVKADSAYITDSKHFETNDSADWGTNQLNRKFELRAVITYEDGEQDEYRASFDWLNPEWQYLALPIEIKKPIKQGDLLPDNLPFTLSGAVCLYFDYTDNIGKVDVRFPSFRPGKWKYSTFDDGGRKLTDEDSESNSVTKYEYDDNNRVIKSVKPLIINNKIQDFATTFEYNKQGKLVRSTDYSGIVNETVYDENGRELKSVIYNLDDPTSKFYSESKRDEKGKITADIDESGEYDCKKYLYEDNTSTVVKDGKGNKTSFGYKNGEIVSISGNVSGEELTNTMHYTAGLLTKVSNGETDYCFTYDGQDRISAVDIAGENYAASEYSNGTLDVTVIKKNNQEIQETITVSKTVTKLADCYELISETDKYGNLQQQTANFANSTEKTTHIYDELRNLKKVVVDINSSNSYNINYSRANGKVVAEVRDGTYALMKNYGYNSDGELENSEYKVGTQSLFYKYETDNTPDKRNSKVTLPFDIEQKFAYDGLGRTKEITLGENLVKDIYYQKFGDHATNRVSTVWYGVNNIRKDSLKYTYDKAGNITTICENGVVIARYVYDGLNRLISENNSQLNQKIKYEYDHAGNIVCKSVNGKKYKYSYPISGWRDKLLSFTYDDRAEECEYDTIGNPTKYRNRNLVWQGRRLISYGKDGKQATYTYDANSVRTSKTVTENGVERTSSKYIYDGNTLVAEQRDGNWIYYLYGVDGIAGFRYNNVTYLYRKNVQGDITHIYEKCEDGSLKQVAHYAYDAYGNVKELQENSAISQLNPFRYRGYYYDTETGLCYLISRYYDPETGRFISADSIEYLDPETLGGLNLYSYCLNNPIMNTDPVGTNVADDLSSVADWIFFVLKMGAGVIKGLSTNLRGTGQIIQGVGSNAKAFGKLMGSAGGVISKVSSVLGYALIAFSNIYDGAQSGKSALNIITDTVFDLAALSLGNLIGTGIGAGITFLTGCPALGTAIGSVVSWALNGLYLWFSSSDIVMELKDGFYNGVNTVVNGIKSFCNAVESVAQSVGNWFRSLFSW